MIQVAILQACAGSITGIVNKDGAAIYKYLNFNQIDAGVWCGLTKILVIK